MSEEELRLLITLDDPVEAPEEDIFNHLQAKNLEDKVMFGQGDWTCTLSRLIGTPNIDVCTVTHRKNGEIVEQKVFYDLAGMQKQIGVM